MIHATTKMNLKNMLNGNTKYKRPHIVYDSICMRFPEKTNNQSRSVAAVDKKQGWTVSGHREVFVEMEMP